MEQKVLIILGSPGSGKGTQANLLSEKFGLYHFRSSGIVGRIIEKAEPGSFIEVEARNIILKNKNS